MDSSRPVYIYGLVDPRIRGIRRIRYVGKTVSLERRLAHHLYVIRAGKETNKRKREWLEELLSLGLTPAIEVLRESTPDRWEQDECEVIAYLRSHNGRLTNASAGGDGVNMPRSDEWKAKIGAAHRGKTMPEEARAKISAANRQRYADGCKQGHPWTEENTLHVRVKNRDGSTRIARLCKTCNRAKTDRYRARRGDAVGKGRGYRPRASHCFRGHPYDATNTYVSPSGSRYCIACSRKRSREYKRRQRRLYQIPLPLTERVL